MAFSVAASAIALVIRGRDDGAASAVGGLESSVARLGARLGKLPTPLTIAASGVIAFGHAARTAAFNAASLARRADQLGTTASQVDRFTRAARAVAGVPFDQSIDALETFQERIGQAAFEPDSEAGTLFARLGVDVRTSGGAVRGTLPVWRDFVAVLGEADRATRNFVSAEFGDVVRDLGIPVGRSREEFEEYERTLRNIAAVHPGLQQAAAEANTTYALLGDTAGVLKTNFVNLLAVLYQAPAKFATDVLGGVNRFFGEASDIEFETLEEAEAHLEELDAKLLKVNAEIAKFGQARYLLKLPPDALLPPRLQAGENALKLQRAEIERLQAATQRFIDVQAGGGDGIRDNQFVAELVRGFKLATTNAQALGEEIERLRADPETEPALIRYLEQQRAALLQQRSTKDVETDRLRLRLKLVGLSAEDAQLATLRHQLEGAVKAEDQEQLRTRIAIVEQIKEATAAHREEQSIETAIATLTQQIERDRISIKGALLAELGVTEQMLAKNRELAALFNAELTMRREAAEAARDEAVFGEVDSALAIEKTRAVGGDVRLTRHLLGLLRQGVAYGQDDLDQLRAKLKLLDELAFANDLREDLRNAVGDGLSEGLRDFAEGGDLGDVFDSIGRRLSSLLLDLAIGQFGQGGAGGAGLLGWLGGLFGGGREHGGPVDAGRLYLVGERGPELFMPRTAGTVLASVGAAPAVTQQITVQGSVRSDADVAAIAQRVSEQAAAGVVRAIRNGRVVAA